MDTDLITFKLDGEERTVDRADYIRAKTKQLQEFGYSTLTEAELEKQLDLLLRKRGRLSAIGKFMEEEVIVP